MFHVVLVEPEIPPNTGNVGRLCLGTGAVLHLVEPLGFSLDDRLLKRAGLDYWHLVDVRRWPSWQAFRVAGIIWFLAVKRRGFPRSCWRKTGMHA